jgi:hypothetical protein
MSDIDRLTTALQRAHERAQAGDAQAAEHARTLTREIRRIQSAGPQGDSIVGQLNAGIAGGLDTMMPDVGLGRAVRGGVNAIFGTDLPIQSPLGDSVSDTLRGMGANIATEDPTTLMGAAARGAGSALGYAPLAAMGAAGVAGASSRPMVSGIADDAARALATRGGVAVEALAGGIAGAAAESVEAAGGPEWAQQTAAMAAPMSIPAAMGATRLAGQAATAAPLVGYATRAGRDLVRSVAPMTEAGAREVARRRLSQLAGGDERAAELAARIDPADPLGRTPAQQTADPNMMGLERSAGIEDPALRARLENQQAGVAGRAQENIAGMGGNVQDARRFFNDRLRTFKGDMQARIDRELQMGTEAVEAVGPRASETANSAQAVARIRGALDEQLAQETALWRAVPNDATIATQQSRGAAESLLSDLPRAQQSDFPQIARQLLLDENGLGDQTTVAELHGLYSELRRISRSAMAGTDQNKNRARIANEIAEGILNDLGAIGGETPAGRAINEARAFSRALHETFDQGAVGRILQRTIDGDTQMTPEAALRRTVGVGGAQAVADDASIRGAAPGAGEEIADYLRGRFLDSAVSPNGQFNRTTGARFLRDNRELLSRYPELRAEMNRAMQTREGADRFAARAEIRAKAVETGSAIARFGGGQDQAAVLSILRADNPAQAARSVAATARRDPTGQAMAGVKGAFTDYLIRQAATPDGLSARTLNTTLTDPQMQGALRQVFSNDEVQRMRRISQALLDAEVRPADVGTVLDSPANRLIEYVVRIAAARQGGQMGGGTMGGSLQTANIFQERARSMLRNLTNDRARQMLMDAIEDPTLFRALLTEPPRGELTPQMRNTLAPYLAGAASVAAQE